MDFDPAIAGEILNKSLAFSDALHFNDCKTVAEARAFSLRNSFLKKWEPKERKGLEIKALDTFLRCNDRCAQFKPEQFEGNTTLALARVLVHKYFESGDCQSNVLDYYSSLDAGRAGPGASRGTRETNFYKKMFCSPLSTDDPVLHEIYISGLSTTWREAELLRYKRFGVVTVPGSSLSTVPKNMSTDRTICTEPSLNMFFQLGAGAVIQKLLEKFHNVDLSKQPEVNRSMARRGSVDGEFATIDLSNASDTISTALVKFLLPSTAFAVLDLFRSKKTLVNKEYVDLHMFSSMGNGFTFPLQTLIFASIVRACYLQSGVNPDCRSHTRNYSVFGDDIICLSRAFDDVVMALESAGFTVNKDKSFNSGSFRESCGGDFFEGHDVRGVYLRKINNVCDLYSIFNRLVRWSIRSGIDIDPLLKYIAQDRRWKMRPVPLHAGDTEGVRIPLDHVLDRRLDRNGAFLYSPRVPEPEVLRIRANDIDYNPAGLLISAIGGYVDGESYTPRVNSVKTKVIKRRTPCWDFTLDPGLVTRDYSTFFNCSTLFH